MEDRNAVQSGTRLRWSKDGPIVISATFLVVFITGLILVPFLFGAELSRMQERRNLIERTDEYLDEIESAAAGAIAAYRGFLLTSDSTFLDHAAQSADHLDGALARVAGLAPAVGEDVRDSVAALQAAVADWDTRLAESDATAVREGQLAYERVQQANSAAGTVLDEELESLIHEVRRLERWWGIAQVGLVFVAVLVTGIALWGAHQLRYHRRRAAN